MTAQLDFIDALVRPPASIADVGPHVCGDCRWHVPTGRRFNGNPTFECTGLMAAIGEIRADFPVTDHGWNCWTVRL